jgi:quercetin dioxygenase-like cupin family protein
MKLVSLDNALEHTRRISREISHRCVFEAPHFSAGVVAFRASPAEGRKQITHADKDLVCHVLKGRGNLRVRRRRFTLSRGMVCHIPRGTPHDFSAEGRGALVLFYSLIEAPAARRR